MTISALGGMMARMSLGNSFDQAVEPPAAARLRRPGWRDPRLWVGLAIVAASILIGAKVMAGADDTVVVWAVPDDVSAGDTLAAEDLVRQRIHFDDQESLAHYFSADDDLPAQLSLLRAVGAGELLPRSAVGSGALAGTVLVSLPVDPLRVPPSVGRGSLVDVFVVPRLLDADKGATTDAGPALTAVTVADVPELGDDFGPTGQRQIVIAVPAEDATAFHALLARRGDAVISLAAHG